MTSITRDRSRSRAITIRRKQDASEKQARLEQQKAKNGITATRRKDPAQKPTPKATDNQDDDAKTRSEDVRETPTTTYWRSQNQPRWLTGDLLNFLRGCSPLNTTFPNYTLRI